MTAPPDSSLTLAIEASNPASHPGVDGFAALGLCRRTSALMWELRVLATQAFARRGEGGLPRSLIEAVDAAVRAAGKEPGAIDRVAVSVGPGGFTSIRTSVATATTLARALGAKAVPVPTAEVVARSIEWQGPGAPRRVAIALASKRDSAWVALVEPPVRVEHPPYWLWPAPLEGRTMTAEELARAGAIDAIVADEHLPEPFRARAHEQGVRIERPVFSAVACFEASLAREPVEPAALQPLYPRRPEAVTLWEQRLRRESQIEPKP